MSLDSLKAGDLTIAVDGRTDGASIRLDWQGKSNDRYPGKVLGPYFSTVVAAAAARPVPIEMHFEKLEHFNSSTITCLIQVIQECRSRSIKLILVFDQALKWQKLSFDALRVFNKGDDLLELRSV